MLQEVLPTLWTPDDTGFPGRCGVTWERGCVSHRAPPRPPSVRRRLPPAPAQMLGRNVGAPAVAESVLGAFCVVKLWKSMPEDNFIAKRVYKCV